MKRKIIGLMVLMILSISTNLLASYNWALNFDGGNDYVTKDGVASSTFRPTSKLTLEAWIYPHSQGSYDGIITYLEDSGASESGYGLYFYNGQLRFWVALGSGSGQGEEVHTTVSNNRWYHVAGVYNGSTMKLYLNGNLVASSNKSGSINYSYLTGNSHPRIGVYADSNEQIYYDGLIDEARIWSDARTESEINAYMYKSIINGTNPGNLICSVSMNEGTGDNIDDRSSNNYSFVRYGASWTLDAAPVADCDSNYDDYVYGLWYDTSSSASVDSRGLTVSVSGLERNDCYAIGRRTFDGTTTADCPEDIDLRASQVWYIEDNGDERLSLVFDLSVFAPDLYDLELEADNYYVLIRSGLSGDFSAITNTGITVNGDQISLGGLLLAGGTYLTIGKDNDPAEVTTATISNLSTNRLLVVVM